MQYLIWCVAAAVLATAGIAVVCYLVCGDPTDHGRDYYSRDKGNFYMRW